MNKVDIISDFPEYVTVLRDQSLIDDPLWYHKKGLMQTATGYGSKLTTQYKINFEGRNYRVYCTCFSNSGSLWFTAKGKKYFIN
jgi:hypothetical protein